MRRRQASAVQASTAGRCCRSLAAAGPVLTLENLLPLLLCALAGYLLGSIPSGYIVVKAFTGQDVRKIGSGRTGGTNVLRVDINVVPTSTNRAIKVRLGLVNPAARP